MVRIWRAVEGFFLGDRWRRDEHAWRVWQQIENYRPVVAPAFWRQGLVSGRVVRTYQQARSGTKALVDFGPAVGVQDTWWRHMRPPKGSWVLVEAHLWPGPDTHSGGPVVWIDRWDSIASKDTGTRALRHERRMAKLAKREPRPPTAKP